MLTDGALLELKLNLSSMDHKLDVKRSIPALNFTLEALVIFVPDRSTLKICKMMYFSIPRIYVPPLLSVHNFGFEF